MSNSELTTAILAKIEETSTFIHDSDQRSALGMARSWINHGKLDTWNPERHKDMIEYPKRDQLAKDLVAILEESGAEEEEMVAALKETRDKINAPYFDPNSNGAQGKNPNFKKKKGENG